MYKNINRWVVSLLVMGGMVAQYHGIRHHCGSSIRQRYQAVETLQHKEDGSFRSV